MPSTDSIPYLMATACCCLISAHAMPDSIECAAQQSAKITADDGAANDDFGNSVALDGDYALIGAVRDDDWGTSSGSAYVFERQGDGTWLQIAKLVADDGAEYDYFGISVSLDGDYALIGAEGDDDNGTSSGSAYVFERQGDGTWLQADKLTADGATANADLGSNVVISAELAMCQARGLRGTTFVYVKQNDGSWLQTTSLPGGDYGDYYQASLAFDPDDGLAVIAYNSANDCILVGCNNPATIYVYELQEGGVWEQAEGVEGLNWGESDFAVTVALNAGVMAVGAPGAIGEGFAYVFERQGDGTWLQTSILTAASGNSDEFGASVALDGDYALIGAEDDGDWGSNFGSAYIFERQSAGAWGPAPPVDCNENGICDFDDIAAEPWIDLNGNGIPDVCDLVTGACCTGNDVICAVSAQDHCLQFGGVWLGAGTTCEDPGCPEDCAADSIGSDDIVNIYDLLNVLESWGPCP